MYINFNGEVNNRHYLVFRTFSIRFLASNLEMHNSVLHFINVHVTICTMYVHTEKSDTKWYSIFTVNSITWTLRCKSVCITTVLTITSYFYEFLT